MTILEFPNKSEVDFLSESNRNKRDMSTVFYDQDNECDINTFEFEQIFDSFTDNGNPTVDNEVAKRR